MKKPRLLAGDRKPVVRSIAGSIVIGFVIFLVVGIYAPDSSAFSPNNYGWNGLQTLAFAYSIHSINSLGDVRASVNQSNSVLLILQPDTNFSSSDALFIQHFLTAGGTVVIGDNYGNSNYLLRELRSGIQIASKIVVVDPLYNWKSPLLSVGAVPRSLWSPYPILRNVFGIAMDEASPLGLASSSAITAFAFSSSESFATTRTLIQASSSPNFQSYPKIKAGPLPLMAFEKYASGTLIVSGDSEFLLNGLLGEASNSHFALNLLNGTTVYLDTANWAPNTAAAFKAEAASVYKGLSQFPMDYLATVGIVEAGVLIAPLYSDAKQAGSRSKNLQASKSISSADSLSRIGHFDEEILDRVRKDRESYGIR